jgi:5-methylcytosine-specific restriction protein A
VRPDRGHPRGWLFFVAKPVMSSSWRSTPLPRDWGRIQPRILRRDRYRCYLCGADGSRKVDHIQPASQGGTDDDDNLAAICDSCEQRKTALEANAAKPKRARPPEPHPGVITTGGG